MKGLTHVVVIADSLLVREGIKAILDRDERNGLIGEAPDASPTSIADSPAPDVVVLYQDAPLRDVCETISRLHRTWPQAAIVSLFETSNPDDIAQLLAAGAGVHVSPSEADRALAGAVCAAARGETWPQDLIAGNGIIHPDGTDAADPTHTARERELLAMIGSGRSNAQIADSLGLAIQTVRNIMREIYGKLNVHTRAEAVVWAREHGFVLEAEARFAEARRSGLKA